MAKPFIKWAGGKTQLLAQFELLIPQDLNNTDGFTYIEPFVGGGAMLFYMLQKFPNMSRAIINDINPPVGSFIYPVGFLISQQLIGL